jgi:hypothetical protein
MVSVLVPYRAGKPPQWEAKRDDMADATVVEVVVEGRKHALRFPRPGTNVAVEVKLPADAGRRASGE